MIKLGIAAAAVGTLVWGYFYFRSAMSSFGFSITGYGRPSLSGSTVILPLTMRFNNPTSLDVNVDQVTADVYVLKEGTWVKAAQVNQPISVPAGQSDQQIIARINLSSLFGGNILTTLKSIFSAVQTKTLQVRTDITAQYGLITIPQQSITDTISLS